jgi:hypothetical protein
MATQIVIETLNSLHCANCGLLFGITADFEARRRLDHKTVFCPMGHINVYNHQTEAERLAAELRTKNDQLAREKHWREEAEARTRDVRLEKEHVERRLRGTKSVVTRMKRRTAAGRCPCCSHQFKNLETHMKTQHPKWNPDRAAEAMAVRG